MDFLQLFDYLALQRYDDSIRVLEQLVEKSPRLSAFVELADVYRLNGYNDLWKPTMERFLVAEGSFLEHARIRDLIAQDYISRGEWKLAEPYAQAAAQSGAAWALTTASDVCEGLQDWTRSEAFIRRTSESYEGTLRMKWYFW